MRKPLIFILTLLLFAGICGCKPRPKQTEEKKGAREPVIVAENPNPETPVKKEPQSEPEPEPEHDPVPEALVAEFFDAAKTGNRGKIQEYADYDTLFALQEGQNADWIFKLILEGMTGEILSSKVDGDDAVVSAKLTNVDMGLVLPLYFQAAGELQYNNAFAENPLGEVELEMEYMEIFSELMQKHKNGKIESLADIELKKFGDSWTIIPGETLADAMCGRYFTTRGAISGSAMYFSPPDADGPAREIDPYDSIPAERPSADGDSGHIFDEDILD